MRKGVLQIIQYKAYIFSLEKTGRSPFENGRHLR